MVKICAYRYLSTKTKYTLPMSSGHFLPGEIAAIGRYHMKFTRQLLSGMKPQATNLQLSHIKAGLALGVSSNIRQLLPKKCLLPSESNLASCDHALGTRWTNPLSTPWPRLVPAQLLSCIASVLLRYPSRALQASSLLANNRESLFFLSASSACPRVWFAQPS